MLWIGVITKEKQKRRKQEIGYMLVLNLMMMTESCGDGEELVGGGVCLRHGGRRKKSVGGGEEAPLGGPFEQQGLGYLVGGHAPGPGQVLHGLHRGLRRRHGRRSRCRGHMLLIHTVKGEKESRRHARSFPANSVHVHGEGRATGRQQQSVGVLVGQQR